ncbi:hypothetical protein [Natrarchaeobius chitinivorans]|uniref:Uncharacterized protein n=1 Tax=Natrarchaeobius chitinivorans TaxID=1679083 RepID=A0A3N6N6R2_NATCH|nr:hypothetical protein [Natrarchaeobius chitinivorans]RQG94072.1 hypothetical protein EA473_13475 [Natrarchaeobius chitinivorans]
MIETLAIGIVGGFLSGVGVYVVRQKRRADRLRQAIATEIRRSTPVGNFKAAVMGPDSLQTPIIDANLDKLYLLNSYEIELVAKYHQHMTRVREYNKRNSDDDLVSISPELQRLGGEIATHTAETLEGNVLTFPKQFEFVKSRYRGERNNKPPTTEQEIEEKRKELIEKAKTKRESIDTAENQEY